MDFRHSATAEIHGSVSSAWDLSWVLYLFRRWGRNKKSLCPATRAVPKARYSGFSAVPSDVWTDDGIVALLSIPAAWCCLPSNQECSRSSSSVYLNKMDLVNKCAVDLWYFLSICSSHTSSCNHSCFSTHSLTSPAFLMLARRNKNFFSSVQKKRILKTLLWRKMNRNFNFGWERALIWASRAESFHKRSTKC